MFRNTILSTHETTHESTGVPLYMIQAWPCELALTNDQKRSIFKSFFQNFREQSILKFISPIRESEQICHDGIQPKQGKIIQSNQHCLAREAMIPTTLRPKTRKP